MMIATVWFPGKPNSGRFWAVKAKVNSTQEQASFAEFSSVVDMDITPKLSLYYADLFQDRVSVLKISAALVSILMPLFLAAPVV